MKITPISYNQNNKKTQNSSKTSFGMTTITRKPYRPECIVGAVDLKTLLECMPKPIAGPEEDNLLKTLFGHLMKKNIDFKPAFTTILYEKQGPKLNPLEFVGEAEEAKLPDIIKKVSEDNGNVEITQNRWSIGRLLNQYLFEVRNGDKLTKITLTPKIDNDDLFPSVERLDINLVGLGDITISKTKMSKTSQDLFGTLVDRLIALVPDEIKPAHIKEYGDFDTTLNPII